MRALRIVGILIGGLLAVLIAAGVALHLLFDPNAYKGRLEAAVQGATGRELALPGRISLSVFPWVAVTLGPASLGNPPGFAPSPPFATVQHASLRVRLLPLLLHRRLEVGHIEIDGLALSLVKNAAGRGNWQMPPSSRPQAAGTPGGSPASLSGIAGILVKDSRVSYQGSLARHVNIEIGRVARGVAVPVKWALDLTRGPHTAPMHIAGHANLQYGAQTAELTALVAKVDDSTLQGEAAVTNLATGAMSFDLTLDHIDLDRYLDTTTARSPAPVPPTHGAQAKALPTGAFKTLTLTGHLGIGSAIVHGVTLSQVDLALDAHDGLLRMAPVSAQLYGGKLAGTITLDARGAVPSLAVDESLTNVQVQPLLTDFAKFNRLSGRGTVSMNLTTQGRTASALLASLDGHVAARLADGAIHGIDLWSTVNDVVSLVQHHSLAGGRSTGETSFQTFQASADLNHGVATTRDLRIASGNLLVTGTGVTQLVTGAVGYHLLATLLKGPGGPGAQAGTLASIPLLVSGTLAAPTVRPDQQAIMKSLAQRELKKNKSSLVKKLGGLLKGLIH